MASSRIRRFTLTERAVHWLVVVAFATMLASGSSVPHRWRVTNLPFDIHVGAACVLLVGLALLAWWANRPALRRTVRDLTSFDAYDLRWLSGAPRRALTREPAPPAGRFNAGQKMNALLASLGLVALYATGLALLVAGRGIPQGPLHTLSAVAMVALISGHVYMAVLNPGTRHALRGMTLGDVDRAWAEHHHPRWVDEAERSSPSGPARSGEAASGRVSPRSP
ncbi:MAG: cytochrome b/b6 domain-containing protein [Gaiellales bacterium]